MPSYWESEKTEDAPQKSPPLESCSTRALFVQLLSIALTSSSADRDVVSAPGLKYPTWDG